MEYNYILPEILDSLLNSGSLQINPVRKLAGGVGSVGLLDEVTKRNSHQKKDRPEKNAFTTGWIGHKFLIPVKSVAAHVPFNASVTAGLSAKPILF